MLTGCALTPGAKHDKALEESLGLCESDVESFLRDPESARFDHTRIADRDSIATNASRWVVKGTVSAKNALGGYADQQYWECVVTRDLGSGKLRAAAEFVDLSKVLADARLGN